MMFGGVVECCELQFVWCRCCWVVGELCLFLVEYEGILGQVDGCGWIGFVMNCVIKVVCFIFDCYVYCYVVLVVFWW